jgi:cell wall-associated NlpC family hydrolase
VLARLVTTHPGEPNVPAPSLQQLAAMDARKYGVPAGVFVRQIRQESGFNPNARSSAGAQGIAQFMPATARAVGLKNPLDPVASLDAAARFDADLIRRYGSVPRALSAYNSGRPDAYLDPAFAGGQTHDYVQSILGGAGKAPAQPQQPVHPGALPAAGAAPGGPWRCSLLSRPRVAAARLPAQRRPRHPLRARAAPRTATRSQRAASSQRAGFLAVERPPTRSLAGRGVVETAKSQIGEPYQYGGPAKLGSATDCSGLLQASLAANGIKIPRTTYAQWKVGQAVDKQHLQPGDAVFFRGSDAHGDLPGHVGIYIGGGRMIEDPHTGATVRVADIAGRGDYVGARRYTPTGGGR